MPWVKGLMTRLFWIRWMFGIITFLSAREPQKLKIVGMPGFFDDLWPFWCLFPVWLIKLENFSLLHTNFQLFGALHFLCTGNVYYALYQSTLLFKTLRYFPIIVLFTEKKSHARSSDSLLTDAAVSSESLLTARWVVNFTIHRLVFLLSTALCTGT